MNLKKTNSILKEALEMLPDTDEGEELKGKIEYMLSHVATGPTRELIASPSLFGSVKMTSVMKALATVGDDLMEMMKGLRTQLLRVAGLNPTYVYILLILNVLLSGFIVYQIMEGAGGTDPALLEKVDQIHRALGIK